MPSAHHAALPPHRCSGLPSCRIAVLPCCRFSVLPCCRIAAVAAYRLAVQPYSRFNVLPCCRIAVLPLQRLAASTCTRHTVVPSYSRLPHEPHPDPFSKVLLGFGLTTGSFLPGLGAGCAAALSWLSPPRGYAIDRVSGFSVTVQAGIVTSGAVTVTPWGARRFTEAWPEEDSIRQRAVGELPSVLAHQITTPLHERDAAGPPRCAGAFEHLDSERAQHITRELEKRVVACRMAVHRATPG